MNNSLPIQIVTVGSPDPMGFPNGTASRAHSGPFRPRFSVRAFTERATTSELFHRDHERTNSFGGSSSVRKAERDTAEETYQTGRGVDGTSSIEDWSEGPPPVAERRRFDGSQSLGIPRRISVRGTQPSDSGSNGQGSRATGGVDSQQELPVSRAMG